MAGLEAEVAMTLLSSAADDFDVEALLNLQHSDSYIKLLPNNNNNNLNLSLGSSSKINLTNDNNAVAPSTVSPKSKNGTKGRKKQIILSYLIFWSQYYPLRIFVACYICIIFYNSLSFFFPTSQHI